MLNLYAVIASLASIMIAVGLSRIIARQIIHATRRRTDGKAGFLAGNMSSAILFAIAFVIVWWAVSCMLMIPWLLWHLR